MDIKKIEELRKLDNFRRFAARSIWNMTVDEALADMDAFLVHLMAKTPEGFFNVVKKEFGLTNEDFIDALRKAPPGEFIYKENWLEWNDKLGINPPLPFPRKYPPFVPPSDD